jgi:hypothetical protein
MLNGILANKLQNDAELDQLLEHVKEGGKVLGEINRFINTNMLRFGPEIQAGLRDLHDASNITDVLTDPRRLDDRLAKVAQAVERLKENIETELKKR